MSFTMASFKGKGSRKNIRNLQGKIVENLWSYRNSDTGVQKEVKLVCVDVDDSVD